MNQNVNPVTAVTVILVAILLISLIFWARQAALMVGGPDQMQVDPEGNVVIHVADTLYKVSPDLELMGEIDLPSMGVHNLVGDFAFFANGDLLIRRGNYEPGFIQSLVRYARLPDPEEPVAKKDDKGLYRCQLANGECSRFGTGDLDFDGAFHLSIDRATDTVYLADTGRHILRKFDHGGKELAVQKHGYRFPNQLQIHDNELLVADTNHHAVQIAQTGDENFGEIITTHRVSDDALGDDSWTYSFAKVGNHWWVNNMGHTMSHGTVAIYDNQWQFQQAINLPASADPIDIAVFRNRVWISDLSNIGIYQLDFDGRLLDTPLPQTIARQLATLKENQGFYQHVNYAMVGLFVLFLVAGFTLAITQARGQPDPAHPSSAEHARTDAVHVNINDPAIEWIGFNQQKKRLLKLAMAAPLLLVAIVPFMFTKIDGMEDILMIVVLVLAMATGPLLTRRIFAMGIGTLGDTLILKKSDNSFAAARGKNIFYSDNNILIGDIYVPFNQQQMLFDTQQVVEKVMPLLREATYVKPGQMINMIIKRQKPATIVVIGAFVLAAVILAMASVVQ
ncbi:MAG: hypothetical protein PVJ39_04525 [Gammaproteobacteria bacterium]|jgi:hypothetical protein